MELTASTWNYLTTQYAEPYSKQSVVNCLHKSMVAVAMLITAIITPLLYAVDLCCRCFKSKPTLNERSVVMQAISILDFYQGGRNDQGVTLKELWKKDDQYLEEEHYFIQWLFPTRRMGVNPTAPLTTDATIIAFKKDKTLRDKMVKSFETMLHFFGFVKNEKRQVVTGPNFATKAKNWIFDNPHNYRRVTRILTSLRLHGLETEAQEFLKALNALEQRYKDKIGTRVYGFWKQA